MLNWGVFKLSQFSLTQDNIPWLLPERVEFLSLAISWPVATKPENNVIKTTLFLERLSFVNFCQIKTALWFFCQKRALVT